MLACGTSVPWTTAAGFADAFLEGTSSTSSAHVHRFTPVSVTKSFTKDVLERKSGLAALVADFHAVRIDARCVPLYEDNRGLWIYGERDLSHVPSALELEGCVAPTIALGRQVTPDVQRVTFILDERCVVHIKA